MSFEDEMRNGLKELLEKVHDNHVQQAEIKVKLDDHVEHHKQTEQKLDEVEDTLEPIKTHVDTVKFVSKYVLAPVIGTILVGLTKILFFA